MISPSTAVQKVFDVVIVGGGLSGLLLANEIHRNHPTTTTTTTTTTSSSLSWHLVEARSTLGGRLANDDKGHRIDLGGAWVWPNFQPHMKRLLQTLKADEFHPISTFRQPDDPSSTRIDGGAVELIHNLARKIPQDHIQLNTPVTQCTLVDAPLINDNNIAADEGTCSNDKTNNSNSNDQNKVIRLDTHQGPIYSKHVVLAVPPKVAWKHIEFQPPLSTAKQQAMKESHTWMAGVTKVSLVYPKQFWNEDISNMGLPRNLPGPAFQVYDASTQDGTMKALTFFTLVPPGSPAKTDNQVLAQQVASQMAQVWKLYTGHDFRHELEQYKDVHVKHWSTEAYISEDANPSQIHPHPHPVRALSTPEWNGQLLFAGTETDLQSPGVMEGAVGAALRVAQELKQQEATTR